MHNMTITFLVLSEVKLKVAVRTPLARIPAILGQFGWGRGQVGAIDNTFKL